MGKFSLKLLLALLSAFSTFAGAQVGGHRLFSDRGTRGTGLNEFVCSKPWSDVILLASARRSDGVESLNSIFAKLVPQAERTARKTPDANATNLQRDALYKEKIMAVAQMVNTFPGRVVDASIVIDDIVTLERPEEPKGNAKDGARMSRFREDRDQYDTMSNATGGEVLMVTGEIASTSSVILSKKDEARIASIVKDNRLSSTEKAKRTQEIRNEAESRRPVHLVYIFGSNDNLSKLRRGNRMTFRGTIQTAGLFVYDESYRLGGKSMRPTNSQNDVESDHVSGVTPGAVHVGGEQNVVKGARAPRSAPSAQKKPNQPVDREHNESPGTEVNANAYVGAEISMWLMERPVVQSAPIDRSAMTLTSRPTTEPTE